MMTSVNGLSACSVSATAADVNNFYDSKTVLMFQFWTSWLSYGYADSRPT